MLVGWLIDSYRPGKQFFSHVATEPPLSGYYQYFWGVNAPCSRTQRGLTRVGLEYPISGSRVRGINHPTRLWYCQPSYMNVRAGQYNNVMPKDLSCLRKLLKIRWQDKIPDTEALKKAMMQSVHTLLELSQLLKKSKLQKCRMSENQRKLQ